MPLATLAGPRFAIIAEEEKPMANTQLGLRPRPWPLRMPYSVEVLLFKRCACNTLDSPLLSHAPLEACYYQYDPLVALRSGPRQQVFIAMAKGVLRMHLLASFLLTNGFASCSVILLPLVVGVAVVVLLCL